MSRPTKGARLYPQAERRDPGTGDLIERAVWVIRDGARKRSTGVPVCDDQRPPPAAEQALGEYLARKHEAPREGHRPLHQIPVADVLAIYLKDRADAQARPKEVWQRGAALLRFWGSRMLSQVTGETCRAYVGQGGTRRQLEDLRSAIEYHLRLGLHREIVRVMLPEKGLSRERWLTRDEAASLIRAAYRYREAQPRWKPKTPGDDDRRRRSRRHVARFILVALYTGTRAGAICAASFTPTEGRGWINLDTGVFYRRPAGERETNKRKAPVRLPDRLLAHLRRWRRRGICGEHAVEWYGRPVLDVDKAFRRAVADAGLGADVTPHVLKHTAITWAMQNGMSKEDAAGFFATTVETIERHYWHHHPDYQREAAARMGSRPRQISDRKLGNEREQMRTNVTKIDRRTTG